MKKMYLKGVVLLALVFTFSNIAVNAQLTLPQGSQLATVSQRIGINDVSIEYSRPSVNGREVWGKLVPYGMNNLGFGTAKESPWRAGANGNTVIKFEDDVKIEGSALSAGKYGLHMIIQKNNKATLIFSKKHTAWGSYFYNPADDALRVDVKMKDVDHTEQLTYTFDDVSANTAMATLRWEKKAIPFKVEVDVPKVVLNDIRKNLENSPGFSRQTWEQAANYALNNGGNLDEALGWINATISGVFFSKKNYNNLNIKSQILAKQGEMAEASKVMDEALVYASVFQIHAYGRQLIGQDQKEKALAVFKMNAKKFKGQWPVDFGLSRGYSALGDYKKALKHLKIASKRAPDQPNKDAIVNFIEQLKKGEDIN